MTSSVELLGRDYLECLQGTHVDIYVGAEREHFSLPIRLLGYRSSVFKSYFAQAADPCLLLLPDDDGSTFAVVAQWVYQGTLPPAAYYPIISAEDFGLYFMADKFDLKKLQDEMLAMIAESYISMRAVYTAFTPEAVGRICRGTSAGSPFRLFGADVLAYCHVHWGLDVMDLRNLFLEFPLFTADFIQAVEEVRAEDGDIGAARLRHSRRYVHA